MTDLRRKVTVLWRGDPAMSPSENQSAVRYPAIIDAFRAENFEVLPLSYLDAEVDRARQIFSESDVVLVWADPISADGNRELLDEVLREAESGNARIYTRPDTILKMGTKDVLFDTRELSWAMDVRRYDTYEMFVEQFAQSLFASGPRVLKQHRGNGGNGVWKVEVVADEGRSTPTVDTKVRIQHAAPRDGVTQEVSLSDLSQLMEPYFHGSGHLIDQAFAPRVAEGMVRVYMVKKQVVGFARQFADRGDANYIPVPKELIFGVPASKTMLDVNDVEFQKLRHSLESEWIPGLQKLVDVSDEELPLLWDTDFLFGPKDASGDDTYLLCEINVSCVSPFPDGAPEQMARALKSELN